MATGTGKTLTALYAAFKVWEAAKPLVLVVVCPYVNLVTQWAKEMRTFGLKSLVSLPASNRDFGLWSQDVEYGFRKFIWPSQGDLYRI